MNKDSSRRIHPTMDSDFFFLSGEHLSFWLGSWNALLAMQLRAALIVNVWLPEGRFAGQKLWGTYLRCWFSYRKNVLWIIYFGMVSFIFQLKEKVERDRGEENAQPDQTDYAGSVSVKCTLLPPYWWDQKSDTSGKVSESEGNLAFCLQT